MDRHSHSLDSYPHSHSVGSIIASLTVESFKEESGMMEPDKKKITVLRDGREDLITECDIWTVTSGGALVFSNNGYRTALAGGTWRAVSEGPVTPPQESLDL